MSVANIDPAAVSEKALLRRVDATGVPLLLIRLAVGGMFAYLAYMKLIDPIAFLKALHGYEIMPTEPALLFNSIVITLPMIEMLCALALIVGFFIRGAALTILLMLVAFLPPLLYRATVLYNDPAAGFATFCAVKFDCGCGTGEVYICSKLAENTALMLGAVLALLSRSRRWTLDGLLRGRRTV